MLRSKLIRGHGMGYLHSNYHWEFGIKRVKRKGEAVVANNVFKLPCLFQVGEDDVWLPTSTAPPSNAGGCFCPSHCHHCASCAGSGYCVSFPGGSLGTKICPSYIPIYKGITRSLSQESSPNWDWVLPFSFVLCSLVCPQTHTKKPSLDMETDVPHNAFPRISFIYLFIYFWKEEIDGFFFFLSTSCFQVHTCEFSGSSRQHGTFLMALNNWKQCWHTALVFCMLNPLGYHVCCNKWFPLAKLEYFPRLLLLWW